MKKLMHKLPRLFWQWQLLLVPLLALFITGMLMLHNERRVAQQEARERADQTCQSVLGMFNLTMDAEFQLPGALTFQLDRSGQVTAPLETDGLPVPHPAAEDESLWSKAFNQALITLKNGDSGAAFNTFTNISGRATNEITGAGVRLRPLAMQAALKIRPDVLESAFPSFKDFCNEVVQHPTFLTSAFLEWAVAASGASQWHADVEQALENWIKSEKINSLNRDYRSLISSIPSRMETPSASSEEQLIPGAVGQWKGFWADSQTNLFLAVRLTSTASYSGFWLTRRDLERIFNDSLNPSIPPYLGLKIDIDGRTVSQTFQKNVPVIDTTIDPLLASRKLQVVQVSAYLSAPHILFVHQRKRQIWFGLLILVSAAAGLTGFVTSQRAFRREQTLNEMKTNFVSSVSHELRAPIASVRLMAEGLEQGAITDKQKQTEYFGFIGQECRRLSSLIENVLDFSRIEKGKKAYDFAWFDATAMISQTLALMITYAPGRQIVLENSGEPQPIFGDGPALQRALINLITNALKHSPAEVRVRVGLEFGSAMLTLWVEDEGEGIPQTEHRRIFDRFHRLGSELRRKTEGVGIGLSIVKHIVEAHGGKIIVRSAPGEGSRFTILLPEVGRRSPSAPPTSNSSAV